MNFLFFTAILLLVVVLPLLLSLRTSKLACVDRFCVACVLSAMSLGVLMAAPFLPTGLSTAFAITFVVGSGLMSLSGFQMLLDRPVLSQQMLAVTLTATSALALFFGVVLEAPAANVVLGAGVPGICFLATGILVLTHPPRDIRLIPYVLVCSAIALAIALLHGVRMGLVFAGYDIFTPSLENQIWLTALQAVRVLFLPLFFLSVVLMLHGTVIAQLRQLVDTDETTGILSRRTFLRECEATLRSSSLQVAFLLLDLDWFKQVNDRHGHAAGDEALVHFVARVQAVIGSDAAFGRLGGEEFGVLLAGVHEREALALSQAICASVRATGVRPGQPGDFTITVSIGLALCEADDGMADLMSRADRALYAAKAAGRDRVCLAETRMDATMSVARAALLSKAEEMRGKHLIQQKRRYLGL
jgi:diguanylate cyclase (GGDEF)-like protein